MPCLVEKAKRSYIPASSRKTTRPLEIIHLDISGPVERSLEGYRYTVVIGDDFTPASLVKTLKKKSELSHTLVEFKHRAEVELQMYGIKLTNIRLDRAGENLSNAVKEFCSNNGIHLEPSLAYSPQSNGCAERLVQEHWIRARILLFSSNLLKYLWPEAIYHANWLRNRLPASRIDNEIPIMRWKSNARIDYESRLEIRSPGFPFIYYSETSSGKKLLPRTQFGHFVGMESDTRLIKVFFPLTKSFKIIRRTDFRKYEGDPLPGVEALLDGIARQVEAEERLQTETNAEAMLIQSFMATNITNALYLASKKKRIDPNVPSNFDEACEYAGWRAAIDREFNACVKRGTWTYVKSEPNMKPVPFTWVFKMKPLDAEGKKFMEKSRCCLRGDRQQAFVDYEPTNIYAPVASHDSIRMLLAIAAAQNLTLEGADISNAYLYSDLDISILMEQPTDSTKRHAMPGHTCKLNKSLYGTKQAGEIWGSLLDKSLKSLGFANSNYDDRIYLYNAGTDFVITAIVVGDLVFASNSNKLLQKLKTHLSTNYDVKLFGKLTSFIGWKISQQPDSIVVNQEGHYKSMLKDYGMETANCFTTPLPKDADLLPAHENETLLNTAEYKKYRSLTGSLLYLAVCTRPDISFPVGVLARQVHAPTVRQIKLLKGILRYVTGTVHYGLKYPCLVHFSPQSLEAYVDADWADAVRLGSPLRDG